MAKLVEGLSTLRGSEIPLTIWTVFVTTVFRGNKGFR
jgi:hypothetical protein